MKTLDKMSAKWVLALVLLAMAIPLVIGAVVSGGYEFTPVAARTFTVNAGATKSSWTVPNLNSGNALHAFYVPTSTYTTNTAVTSAYCGTDELTSVTFASAVATTGTYCLLYIPGR